MTTHDDLNAYGDELTDRLQTLGGTLAPDTALHERVNARADQLTTVHRRRVALAGTGLAAALGVAVVVGVGLLDTPFVPPIEPVGSEPAVAPSDAPTAVPTEEPTDVSTPDARPGVGSWSDIPAGPITSTTHAVWTGEELLVAGWCGEVGCGGGQLASYDPAARAWTELEGPQGEWRYGPSWGGPEAVWTGTQMLIVGGEPTTEDDPDFPVEPEVAGWAYTPATGSWSEVPAAPIAPRTMHSTIWTGDELIVWGGMSARYHAGTYEVTMHADGAAWNPLTESWRVLTASPLAARGEAGTVWDGERMIVLGGGATGSYEGEFGWSTRFDDAAAYDPALDSWESLGTVEGAGVSVATVWTGSEVVQWTGDVSGYGRQVPEAGVVWDPDTGTSTPVPLAPLAAWREGPALSVWAPEVGRMLTWGGGCGEGCNQSHGDGAAFDPATGSWEPLSDAGIGRRSGHAGAWTGSQLLVVGGYRTGDPNDPGDEGYAANGGAWAPGR